MTAKHSIRFAMAALSLLLVASLLAVPAQAAPAPEETALSSPWFRETVSGGEVYTCGLRTDGTLACWGVNSYGQATPPAGTFSQVSAGGAHTCGIQTGGTLACWGRNNYGQATPPAGTYVQVSAGYLHTCGLQTDGTLACWGYNNSGRATPPAGTFSQPRVSAGG